jgi:hypothetical protein
MNALFLGGKHWNWRVNILNQQRPDPAIIFGIT